MTNNEINEKIIRDEYEGEKLINKIRFALSLVFVVSVLVVSIIRNAEGYGHFPLRAHVFPFVFGLFGFYILLFTRKIICSSAF